MVKHIQIQLSHVLNEAEWKVLSIFCEKSQRLLATKMVSGAGTAIHGNISFEQGSGLRFKANLPPEELIAEFLMAFRFFYLQKEPAYFPAVLGIIGKHTSQQEARQALKIFRHEWEECLFGNAMFISLNNQPITSSLLIDLWFNAHYFHSDVDKEAELGKLKEVFSEDFAKFMLLNSAFEATKVVLKVFDGIREMVNGHFEKS